MPSGPFISFHPNVVVFLDGKSFPALFDTEKVEKKNLIIGTFMPSTDLTDGYRILSYLDPSEPNHAMLEAHVLHALLPSRSRHAGVPRHLRPNVRGVGEGIGRKWKGQLRDANDLAAFNFLARSFFDASPNDSKLGFDGPKIICKWVLFHLYPLLKLGLPRPIEDGLLHTIPLLLFLIKKEYQWLYDFFYENSSPSLDQAEILGVSRDEACHNLGFATFFNTFGGMKIFFPNMLK